MDESNRGYSSFFFNRNNTKDHCVIGQVAVFTSIRIAVATILILLQLLTVIGGPLLLVSYYVRLHDTIIKDPNQWDYMWATVLVLVLVDCVVSSWDLLVISDGLHENSRFGDVKYYYYISFIVIIAHPFVNLCITIIFALLLDKRTEMQKKYIPCLGPCRNSTYILYTLCCDCSRNFSSTNSDCIPKLLYSVSLYCFPYPCMFYSISICRRLILFGGVHHFFYQSTQTSKKGMSSCLYNHNCYCSITFRLCFYTNNNTSRGAPQ